MSTRRRSIGRGLSAAAQAVAPILAQWTGDLRQDKQNNAILERQKEADQRNRKQALEDKVAKGEMSPEQAQSIWQNESGKAEPFDPFQPSLDSRMGKVSGEISAADSLSKLPTEGRVRRRAQELGIPTAPVAGETDSYTELPKDGELQANRSIGPVQNPAIGGLMNELSAAKSNLQAQVPTTGIDYRDEHGVARRRQVPQNQTAGIDEATEASPEQDANKALAKMLADLQGGGPQMRGVSSGQEKVSEINTAGAAEAQQAGRLADAGNASHLKYAGPTAEATARGTLNVEGSPQGLQFIGDKAAAEANAKPPSADELKANDFGGKTAVAHQVMLKLEPEILKRGDYVNLLMLNAPDSIADPTTKLYVTAMREFINSALRRESGAAISNDEFARFGKQYGLNVGETGDTLKYKQDARRRAVNGLASQSGAKLSQDYVSIEEIRALAKSKGMTEDDAVRAAQAEHLKVVY